MIGFSSDKVSIRDESPVRIADDEYGAVVDEWFVEVFSLKIVCFLYDSTTAVDGHYFTVKSFQITLNFCKFLYARLMSNYLLRRDSYLRRHYR